MIYFSFALGCCLSIASAGFSEDTLAAMPTPAERPYPYEILGPQPGDPLDYVLAVYAERSDAAPTRESEVLRVQSPDGAVFEFTYQLYSRIGDFGINGRLARAAQDQVAARLPSDVIEQHPMAIYRCIRLPSDELPEQLELNAQIEETYGPPSRVEINGHDMVLTYAWSTDGFIPDLDALGQIRREETTRSGGQLIRPGCVATFKASYRGEPGMTSISFSLENYELSRVHTEEMDRQIVDALTGEEVESSDMDL